MVGVSRAPKCSFLFCLRLCGQEYTGLGNERCHSRGLESPTASVRAGREDCISTIWLSIVALAGRGEQPMAYQKPDNTRSKLERPSFHLLESARQPPRKKSQASTSSCFHIHKVQQQTKPGRPKKSQSLGIELELKHAQTCAYKTLQLLGFVLFVFCQCISSYFHH